MTATTAHDRPDPSRTGAVWVTGTGAFLLLAAAAVFTAVRWDQIPPSAKLAALGLFTGGCLLAGRRLAEKLPATAGALFHLGTFLVPIDVAAVGVRAELDWSGMLLAQGLAATITFWWAASVERSVVLRWAWGGAVVVLAGGIGATTGAPVPLVLAGIAGAAAATRLVDLPALGWAGIAGLAPVGALIERSVTTGSGVFERLGLTAERHPAASAVAAVLAAGTIAVVGRRRDQGDLVVIAAVVAAAGVASAWFATDPGAGSTGIALAATFLAVQLAAFAVREDPFWRPPVAVIAAVTEMTAGIALVGLAATALVASAIDEVDPGLALTTALLGAGWVVADRRRGEVGLTGVTSLVALAAAASAGFLTDDPIILGSVAATIAVGAVLVDRRDAALVALAAAVAAPVLAHSSTVTVGIVTMIGALCVAESAVRRSHRAAPGASGRLDTETAWLLGASALVPIVIGVSTISVNTGRLALSLVGGALACTAVAAWLDRGVGAGSLPFGTLVRTGSVGMLVAVADLPPREIGLVAGVVAVLSMADALRLHSPRTALGASLAMPVAIGAFVHSTGVTTAETGVALTVTAVVLAGLGSLLGREWIVPVLGGVAVAAGGGLLLSSGDPTAFANALIVTGGLGLTVGTVLHRTDVLLGAGLVVTGGWWLRLADAGVDVSEPYLVPVTAVLLLAALRSRAEGTSSWIAYGPAIALLGGSALSERVAGGAGWHSLVAGSVAIVGVVAGGQRRLAAPLVLGTALLVALVGFETLAVTAALPTWVWLALGGTALVGAGVAMERHEIGPIETGRRLVDVVNERYS